MSVIEKAKLIEQQIIQWRRAIHSHPELDLETPKTAHLVASALRDMGVEVRERVGGHGVVGLLRGTATPGIKGAERTVALRADMDALPIEEDTGLPFASKIPGRMHACGHDAHVAMLLGAAKVLSDMKPSFSGSVKFIFQPGEEGSGGARLMIADGCLEDPVPEAIFGAHIGTLWSGLGSGQVGVKSGPLMAATDRFYITVKGKGGHGAYPHASIDPVVVGSHIVSLLQTIVSREVSPLHPAVVTVGLVKAGTVENVIPQTCLLSGTVRYLNREMADFIPKRVREIAQGVAHALRAEAEVEYRYGYPPVVNDRKMTELLAQAASKIVGESNVITLEEPTMGGEDMAFYLEKIPGTFYGLGSYNQSKGKTYPHHHPKFDIDEDVLHLGTAVMVQTCLDFLGS